MAKLFCKHCRRPLKKIHAGRRGNGFMHVAGGWKHRQPKCKGPEPGGRPPELKGQRELFPKRAKERRAKL